MNSNHSIGSASHRSRDTQQCDSIAATLVGIAVGCVLLGPLPALAQNAAQQPTPTGKSVQRGGGDASQSLPTVIVTGTRQSGLSAADSPAPIQIIDAATLQRAGQPDTLQALVRSVPSFTSDAKGGDASALTVAARLRGLSPNHTLVLINGKRRHGTSNVDVALGPFQGGAAADLSLIPVAAIDHIEVLQDGAAAQYGSDAIAGVINVILKSNHDGGVANVKSGQYYKGDGESSIASSNLGLRPSENSFLNLTAESVYRRHSDRSDLDARFVAPFLTASNANVVNVPDYPYVNKTFGDPRVRQNSVAANTGLTLGETELYGFATFSRKEAEAIQNYRGPSTAFAVYPLGFSPVETHDEHELSITAGVKGRIFDEWTYDLSGSYGRDNAKVGLDDGLNVQLWQDTGSNQSDFYEGYLKATQRSINLDVSRGLDVGWSTPLNVAFGYENRVDGYAIGAGEPASVYRGGAAAFPGFTTTDAGSHHRTNNAVYVDVAGSPIEQLLLDVAIRAERYSDFGSATVGKLTGRYEFNKTVSVRGTVSTGFRAPTLAEDYYSATQVSPTTATVLLPASSAGAEVVGLGGLDTEKSKNLSVGVVINPLPRLTLTLDAYRIEIDDRILKSGVINGLLNDRPQPAFDVVNRAIAANGNTLPAGITSTGVSLFANAADTENDGIDFVLSYAANYGNFGRVDWSIAANYNRVEITHVKSTPSQFAGALLLDQAAISNLETASPKYRVNLAAVWNLNDWTVDLRTNLFGPSSYDTTIDNVTYYENRIGAKPITDLSISRKIGSTWLVTVGANNLFDVYPDKLNPAYRSALNANGRQNVQVYNSASPIGINGGAYFGSLTYKF